MKLLTLNPADIIGNIKPPLQIQTSGNGEQDISKLINAGIQLLFSVAAVAFVIMILWSAISWILSGGDKEAVAKARARLTWAVIGVVILSTAFAIFRILESITGFTFFH